MGDDGPTRAHDGAVTDTTTLVEDLEVRRCRPDGDRGALPVVLLHEGLGSVALWRDFPVLLAAATGREVVAWSRPGHGRSAPMARPHGPDYMHLLAADVPRVLGDVLGIDRAVLLGHSDGASIALLHAASAPAADVPAIALLAPHVVVEERSLEGIEAARARYATTDLPDRMARHHDDADALFRAWNDVWLSDEFRDWDITAVLDRVTQPVLLVQCADDDYGTLHQLDLVEAGVAGPTARLVLERGGHSPHLADPGAVCAAVRSLVEHVD